MAFEPSVTEGQRWLQGDIALVPCSRDQYGGAPHYGTLGEGRTAAGSYTAEVVLGLRDRAGW